MTQREFAFLKVVVPAAQQSQRQYRVPASVTIAQAILESGWGESALAVKAKNYFGIKEVLGEDYVEFPATEFVAALQRHVLAKFVKYDSVGDCFKAHARLLSTRPRYAPAMQFAEHPEIFAQRLQECGYATDPNYGSLLVRLIGRFDLKQYDIEPESGPAKEVAA